MTRKIPTFDLSEFYKDKEGFAQRLGTAYQEFGFVGLTNHGVPDDIIKANYDACKAFFAQPEDIKKRYYNPEGMGQRGYTPFGVEGAKDRALGDLKEFWHTGRDLPADSPYRAIMADNYNVAEVANFDKATRALFASLEGAGDIVLRALAIYLKQPEDFFAAKTNCGNSILRTIHYPPIDDLETPALRAGAHEDINLITLLVGSGEPGLEVQARDGEWIPIDTIPGTIVCNIGDMLQRFTNNVLPSTTHRVVNPTGEGRRIARYSSPFFLHLNPDVVISTLPSCITADRPNAYPEPIRANDYLLERLREIGLGGQQKKQVA
ncbi:MAG: isopenicillin N synthase family dioxygenase [Bdellovibrionales bacterium]